MESIANWISRVRTASVKGEHWLRTTVYLPRRSAGWSYFRDFREWLDQGRTWSRQICLPWNQTPTLELAGRLCFPHPIMISLSLYKEACDSMRSCCGCLPAEVSPQKGVLPATSRTAARWIGGETLRWAMAESWKAASGRRWSFASVVQGRLGPLKIRDQNLRSRIEAMVMS